jgi:hypothetical protein
MLDLRSPTKADYRRHPHHLRFATQAEGSSPRASSPAQATSSRQASASAQSSPMLGGSASSSSAARLAEHFQARSFSLSTPSTSSGPPASFQPRVLDDVFGSGGAGADRSTPAGCASTSGDVNTPTGHPTGQPSPSWLLGATAHERSFPMPSSAYLPASAGGSNLPLFSPFDPFAATPSSVTAKARSPGLSGDGSPSPTTPSTAYMESLTRAHRGSFLRSLSSTSTSSSFSASGPYAADCDGDDTDRLGFPCQPAHELVSPSGESLADVTDFYFSSDAGGGGSAHDEDEEMMTESDTTECAEARTSQLLSPTRSERSTYAEQLREYTLSVRPQSPSANSRSS